jgi:hypothetical protein
MELSARMQAHMARWKDPKRSKILVKETCPELVADNIILPRLIVMVEKLIE